MTMATKDTVNKVLQYDALTPKTPTQDEEIRPNERDPFMGPPTCHIQQRSPNTQLAQTNENTANCVKQSICSMAKIYIQCGENCAIYLNGSDMPTLIILDGKVLT